MLKPWRRYTVKTKREALRRPITRVILVKATVVHSLEVVFLRLVTPYISLTSIRYNLLGLSMSYFR